MTPPEVFINSPYDLGYENVLDAVVLTTVFFGLTPTSALTSGDTGKGRMERILEGIESADFSIHDLSRCRGEGDEGLTRMNMPLELGMAIYRSHHSSHRWMALVPDDSPHQQYISDLAGYDLKTYGGDADQDGAISRVASWYRSVGPVDGPEMTPAPIRDSLPLFNEIKRRRCREWPQEPRLPWFELVAAAAETIDSYTSDTL